MLVSDIIKQEIADKGVQQKDVAAFMGWTPQNFANRLRNNTVDGDEFVKITNHLGYDIKIVDSNGNTVEERKKGIGGRAVQMVDRVIYDTEKSDAICHTSEFAESFFELYKNEEYGYFIVLYAKWTNWQGIIMPANEFYAKEFMKVCKYKEE